MNSIVGLLIPHADCSVSGDGDRHVHRVSYGGAGAMLHVRGGDATERCQHVRHLSAFSSGHYRRFAEVGHGSVLPGVRPLPPAASDVGEGGA